MHTVNRSELRRFNAEPIDRVRYWYDIDFVGDRTHSHRLDVMAPADAAGHESLPVYVYFHGGGCVAGDLDTHDATASYLCQNTNAVGRPARYDVYLTPIVPP